MVSINSVSEETGSFFRVALGFFPLLQFPLIPFPKKRGVRLALDALPSCPAVSINSVSEETGSFGVKALGEWKR